MSFVKYLDTIVAAHAPPPGSSRHNYSPWLFLDAAHVLFQTAKSRVYQGKITSDAARSTATSFSPSLLPVLEEQPKWAVLADVLEEIDHDAYLNPVATDESNDTIVIMCSDNRTCRQLREYLSAMYATIDKDTPDGTPNSEKTKPSAEVMMRRKLRDYLRWKIPFSNVSKNLSAKPGAAEDSTRPQRPAGAPLQQERAPPNKRRRVRGGGMASSTGGRAPNTTVDTQVELPGQVTGLLDELHPTEVEETQKAEIIIDNLENMEDYYELYDMNDLVLVHPYDGDMDEHILEEARPRYIIMFEPDAAFIRRVEVYRSSHSGRNVRVYFLYYGGSVEEQRYLSAVRREKDAFTKLIREKSVS